MTDLIRAYFDPEKHAQEIPVHRVVSDEKVDEGHVARIGDSGLDPRTMRPIVVIKHPKVEAYAVLDGHHRFHIVQGMGCETIRAAVVDDYVGLGFYLTKKGVFQPTPEFTKYVRVPLKRFIWWMTAFLKDPRSIPEGPPEKDPKLETGESSQVGSQRVETPSGHLDQRGEDVTGEVRFEMSERRTLACLDVKGPYEEVLDPGFEKLFEWLGPRDIVVGPAVGIYHDDPHSVPPEELRSTVACIVREGAQGEGEFRIEEIGPREEAVLLHRGPHEDTGPVYELIIEAIERGSYRISGPPMEVYLSEWPNTPPEKLLTEIRVPVERSSALPPE